jgi:hypothetical protein
MINDPRDPVGTEQQAIDSANQSASDATREDKRVSCGAMVPRDVRHRSGSKIEVTHIALGKTIPFLTAGLNCRRAKFSLTTLSTSALPDERSVSVRATCPVVSMQSFSTRCPVILAVTSFGRSDSRTGSMPPTARHTVACSRPIR